MENILGQVICNMTTCQCFLNIATNIQEELYGEISLTQHCELLHKNGFTTANHGNGYSEKDQCQFISPVTLWTGSQVLLLSFLLRNQIYVRLMHTIQFTWIVCVLMEELPRLTFSLPSTNYKQNIFSIFHNQFSPDSSPWVHVLRIFITWP